METITSSSSSGYSEKITGTIYAPEVVLDEYNGRTVEIMHNYLTMVLEDQYSGHPYELTGYTSVGPDISDHGSDQHDVQCDSSFGPRDEFKGYLEDDAPEYADDFNLMLTYEKYGTGDDRTLGCGGGRVAVTEGAPDINNLNSKSASRYQPAESGYKAIQTGIHEVGHCFGMDHADGYQGEEEIHGYDYWVMSPLKATRGEDNSCGWRVGTNPNNLSIWLDMHYAPCARSKDNYQS